jgi:hypothetical protein
MRDIEQIEGRGLFAIATHSHLWPACAGKLGAAPWARSSGCPSPSRLKAQAMRQPKRLNRGFH